MATKHTKIPNLTEKTCRLGKISNNLERHGDDYVTAFTIPITELMLTKAELNALMRDKFTHQSWFDNTKTGGVEPMDWWNGEEFSLSQAFDADELTITVSGGAALNFESEGDPKDEDYRAAAKISGITLTPRSGGMTEMRLKLYVLPDIGKKNLQLQEHQHREVKVSWRDARAVEKAKRQPELPMEDRNTGTPASAETSAAAPH